jgi:putative acetyltransferase
MPASLIEVVPAHGTEFLAHARGLFREYADAIGVDLEYQGFAAELAGLPSPYEPPHGALLIARIGDDIAGCVALRRLDERRGEMKRLYVRPAHRSSGTGRRLVEAVIQAARQAGYSELRLDTLPSMASAQGLYRKLGFTEIPPYSDAYLPGTRFFALALTPAIRVRAEDKNDWTAVRAVNTAAFGASLEADLVDALRVRAQPLISLVAEIQGAVVGHIMFSPVALAKHDERKLMGLGPMAVLPEHQRKGVGSALVRAGLKRCEELGCDAVVLVGHAEYYPRFGFVPAARYGISCQYDVPEDVFMILELRPGALRGATGHVQYHEAFNDVT